MLWWAWPIGALLAIATHLADALPDVERPGHRRPGLATRLGVGRAAAVAAACYLAAVAWPCGRGWRRGTARWWWPGRRWPWSWAGRPARRRPRPRRPPGRLPASWPGMAALALGWAGAVRP